jgi:hypothetical protein
MIITLAGCFYPTDMKTLENTVTDSMAWRKMMKCLVRGIVTILVLESMPHGLGDG